MDFDTIIATFVQLKTFKAIFAMRLKPPKFLRRLMPDLVWDIEDQENVFLTFDDGPTPGITE